MAATIDKPIPIDMKADDFASRKLESGKLLWHYTRDFAAFSGIVAGEIWASSVRYLNDTEEFGYGVKVALDTLKELLDDSEHTKELYIALVRSLLVAYTPDDVFSISFSTEEDDLSQWRAYSGVGPAFSIGFDPHTLERHANGYLFQLHEVIYEQGLIAADVGRELQAEICEMNEALRRGTADSPRDFTTKLAPALSARILQLAPRYKHPKFSAEREWRLVRWSPIISHPPRLPRRYRLSGSLVVPYIAMPMHTPLDEQEVFQTGRSISSPMVAVRIGPSPHPDELKYAIEDMTARKGIRVDVRSSDVPFRNW
jgi:hypothetical protein